ncbi:hypothetical protein [Yeosuana marina]|uniref:hypothetical protein n=1 Tax=Yeosuana marina TaxID=1565536 RepID=UPI0030ED157D|tara:strand:+ start:938 stop:1468 length:531 start_codon:yes stop_codon:yes gene_type:complete
MKIHKTVLLFIVTLSLNFVFGQDNLDSKYLEKVNTIENTMNTLYSVISGEKGQERDWDLLRYLYYPKAQMAATGTNRQGVTGARYLSPEGYINNSGKWLVENGFFEKEIHRVTEQFGNIAHVFSTYHCFHSETDRDPFMRGINSVQLMYNGKRWWVMNIFWAQETKENPIPKKYLP